jgi:hypothetical protein
MGNSTAPRIVQTFGDLVNFNPHLQMLVADRALLSGKPRGLSPIVCPVPVGHAQCDVEPFSSELSWHRGQTS